MAAIPVPLAGDPTAQSWAAAVAGRLNGPPGCMLERRASWQTITTGAYNDIGWDTELRDTGFWTSGASLTIPEAGFYAYSVQLALSGSSAGTQRYMELCLNGATGNPFNGAVMSPNANALIWSMASQIRLAVGNTLKVRVLQDSGGNLNMTGATLTLTKIAE